MTYRELMQLILSLPSDVIDQPVTVALLKSGSCRLFQPDPYVTDENEDDPIYPNGRLVLPVDLDR